MSDIPISESQPEGNPPQEVRFSDLKVEPWDDKTRLKILVQITPFNKNPDLEFQIESADGSKIAQVSIIENIESKFVFTMHLRNKSKQGPYLLIGTISYEEIGIVDQKTYQFEI